MSKYVETSKSIKNYIKETSETIIGKQNRRDKKILLYNEISNEALVKKKQGLTI